MGDGAGYSRPVELSGHTASLPAHILLLCLNPMACGFALLFAVTYEGLVTEIKGSGLALPKLPPDLPSLVASVHITDLLQTRLPI